MRLRPRSPRSGIEPIDVEPVNGEPVDGEPIRPLVVDGPPIDRSGDVEPIDAERSTDGDGGDPGHAAPADDGRRRRRAAVAVVLVAALSAVGGAVVGSRLKSPADAAREREPPGASRITVPVERRALSSSLTLSGEIRFAEPTPVKLAGPVGTDSGESPVVTRVPELDQQVAEGDVLLDVSGRPVFLMQGDLPMYRSLSLGSEGDDVVQLEAALARLGFDPGPVDALFDGATAAALDAFYTSIGYRSVGPSDEEQDRLRQLRDGLTTAEENVRRAGTDLESAGERISGAELLALQQTVAQARDQVPRAEAQAQRNNDAAAEAVANATTSRDAAVAIRDAAHARYETATAPDAIDPLTGEPYTADEIAARQTDLAVAEDALAQASNALSAAQNERANVADQGAAELRQARDARTLAEAQLADAQRPPDTSAAQQALDDAQQLLTHAREEYERVAGETGTRLPPGEVVFVSLLPSTVTGVTVAPGSPATDVLLTLSSAETQVISRVSRSDSGLVQVGAEVRIELRDFDVEFTGIVAAIGQPQGGDSGGRLDVTINPSEPAAMRDYVFTPVRVIIDIAATSDEVLVVPIAALSVGGDGSSRVEVERVPARGDDDPGSTETVRVEVGLTAQGLVEVRPIDGSLDEGDRVVVGAEVSERRNRDRASSGDSDEDADQDDGDGDESEAQG